MFKFLIVILCWFSTPVFAESYYGYVKKGDFLKVEEMYMEYRKIEAWRNPYYPPEKDDWQFTNEFNWTVSMWDHLFWENKIHMSMDCCQIRHAGWQYYLGYRVFDWFSVIKYHHSEHVLENKYERRFPVEDSYGFRIYFKH